MSRVATHEQNVWPVHCGMMHRLVALLSLVCSLACSLTLSGCQSISPDEAPASAPASPAWYEPEIRAFERADAAATEPGRVLFIGSSSIRMWKTLAEDMAPAPVLNRGFGGSRTGDVLAVFDRIVRPYDPSVIVYYCGDNDLGTDNIDWRSAAEGFLEFDRRARALWPDLEVLYLPIKPSLARWSNWEAMAKANGAVRAYCGRTAGATYVDTVTPMLTDEGTPRPELFLADGLHLNEAGYEVWAGVARPLVLEAWKRRRPSASRE